MPVKYLINTAVVMDLDEDELLDVVRRMEQNVREQIAAGVMAALIESGRTIEALADITDEQREEAEQRFQFFGVSVAPINDLVGMILGSGA